MKKLSVIILTKNEEENIGQCLKTVEFADEIIVVDDYSEDKTVEIAKKHSAKVYQRKLDDFASQRNYGLAKATGEWILFVDADERVTEQLKEEIKSKIQSSNDKSSSKSKAQNQINGFKIPRENRIFGKFLQYTDWYPDYQPHLFRRDKGKYQRQVHEQVEVRGEVGKLKNPLTHFNYDSIDKFLQKNYFRYADLEAELLIASGYKFDWADLFRKPVGEFLRRFFSCDGYKDGLHGLVASILVSFATFVVYAKVWEKEGFREKGLSIEEIDQEYKALGQEMGYWIKEAKIREEKNVFKKIFLKVFT